MLFLSVRIQFMSIYCFWLFRCCPFPWTFISCWPRKSSTKWPDFFLFEHLNRCICSNLPILSGTCPFSGSFHHPNVMPPFYNAFLMHLCGFSRFCPHGALPDCQRALCWEKVSDSFIKECGRNDFCRRAKISRSVFQNCKIYRNYFLALKNNYRWFIFISQYSN